MALYFYAAGRRHELRLDEERLAIDTRLADSAGLRGAVEKLPVASRLPSGVIIIDRHAENEDLIKALDQAGATRPVCRWGEVLVVPMPEVRVEFEPGERAASLYALELSGILADITEDTAERLSLRPRSGRSIDALKLANFIYERARPASASVRMLQIVPRRRHGA